MKITDDLVKSYVEFDNKTDNINREVEQFKREKLNKLYDEYTQPDITIFSKMESRISNYSVIFMPFMLAALFLGPVIACLIFASSYKNLDIKFMVSIAIIGLSFLIIGLSLLIKNNRLVRKYNKFKKEP